MRIAIQRASASAIANTLSEQIKRLKQIPLDTLLEQRYQRLMKHGTLA